MASEPWHFDWGSYPYFVFHPENEEQQANFRADGDRTAKEFWAHKRRGVKGHENTSTSTGCTYAEFSVYFLAEKHRKRK